jgi:hypothetical protein
MNYPFELALTGDPLEGWPLLPALKPTLHPADPAGAPLIGRWHPTRGRYIWPQLPPGPWRLRASAAGYHPLEKHLHIHPAPTRETFTLRRLRAPTHPLGDLVLLLPHRTALDPTTGQLSSGVVTQLATLGYTVISEVPLAGPGGGTVTLQLPGGAAVARFQGPLPEDVVAPLRPLWDLPELRAAGRLRFLGADRASADLETGAVVLGPRYTPPEARALLRRHRLEIVGSFFAAPGAWRVRPLDRRAAIAPLLAALDADPDVRRAAPERIRCLAGDAVVPVDFLWSAQWDLHLTGVPDAWQALKDAGKPTQGDPDLVAAVLDDGVLTYSGDVEHPDLNRLLSNGLPKLQGRHIYDFEDTVRAHHNDAGGSHGTRIAGLLAGAGRTGGGAPGVCGVAAGVGLLSARIETSRDYELAAGVLWSAGLGDTLLDYLDTWFASDVSWAGDTQRFYNLEKDPRPQLICGARNFGQGATIEPFAELLLDYISRRARGGKGAPFFASSSASGPTADNVTERPWAEHERTFACAASTFDSGGNEIVADYTGRGDIAWAAPSSDAVNPSPPDPPGAYAVWSSAPMGSGHALARPLGTTKLTYAVGAGVSELVVDDISDFVAKTCVQLGSPGSAGQLFRITAVDTGNKKLSVSPNTRQGWAAGTAVHRSTEVLTTLSGSPTVNFFAWPVTSTFKVNSLAGISAGDHVGIETTSGNNWYGVVESVSVGPPDEITFEKGAASHAIGGAVYRSSQHEVADFGATSAATAHAAGIGALVLTANPDLTWVELREIMARTAQPVDITDGDWEDDTGAPATSLADAEYSPLLGYGRLRAAPAVKRALAYSAGNTRDLWLRNIPADTGTAATLMVNSPDIWVRNQSPATDPYPTLHRNPKRSSPSWIYARVRNRGSRDSLDAWVRFYVAGRKALGADYRWPEDFDTDNSVILSATSWARGTVFLGERKISGVPAGGFFDVFLRWPVGLKPPRFATDGKLFRPRLLVEITPHDGPLSGDTVLDNNNLSQRRVRIRP